MSQALEKRGIAKNKIKNITNWADGGEVFPIKIQKKSNDIVFQYFGNIGKLQGINLLLESLKNLNPEKVNFKFIGRGSLVNQVEIKTSNLKHVSIEKTGNKQNKNIILNECDIAIVSIDPKIVGLGVPSKTYYSLAAGKPLLVITPHNCEIAIMARELGVGIVVDTNPNKVARCIENIASGKILLPSPEYVRKIFEQNFSKEVAISNFIKQIENLE